jgi:hypothetical protein
LATLASQSACYDAHVNGDELTEQRLADLLREAERAHGEYERELGGRHEDWPAWYARYILERLRGL